MARAIRRMRQKSVGLARWPAYTRLRSPCRRRGRRRACHAGSAGGACRRPLAACGRSDSHDERRQRPPNVRGLHPRGQAIVADGASDPGCRWGVLTAAELDEVSLQLLVHLPLQMEDAAVNGRLHRVCERRVELISAISSSPVWRGERSSAPLDCCAHAQERGLRANRRSPSRRPKPVTAQPRSANWPQSGTSWAAP